MRTIEIQVFEFDELSDAAKEKARDWYRERGFHYEWWDQVYEDAFGIADLMGLDIRPGHRDDRERGIQFSGFASQGDGACFAGYYKAQPCLAAVKEYAPQDEVLHRIASSLDEANAAAGTDLTAEISASGRYCHARMMNFEFDLTDAVTEDEVQVYETAVSNAIEALRDFADWIYRQLEDTDSFLRSDENVDETIRANEYTFCASGARFG